MRANSRSYGDVLSVAPASAGSWGTALNTQFASGVDYGSGVSFPGYRRTAEFASVTDAVFNAADGSSPSQQQLQLYDTYHMLMGSLGPAAMLQLQDAASLDIFKNTGPAKAAYVASLKQVARVTDTFLNGLNASVVAAAAAAAKAANAQLAQNANAAGAQASASAAAGGMSPASQQAASMAAQRAVLNGADPVAAGVAAANAQAQVEQAAAARAQAAADAQAQAAANAQALANPASGGVGTVSYAHPSNTMLYVGGAVVVGLGALLLFGRR